MESLRDAIGRLERRGYVESFRAGSRGMLHAAQDDGRTFAPEDLIIEEVVRFEGPTDPEEQAVIFALRSDDGRVRGTFVTTYGPPVDPNNAAAIERLGPMPDAASRRA